MGGHRRAPAFDACLVFLRKGPVHGASIFTSVTPVHGPARWRLYRVEGTSVLGVISVFFFKSLSQLCMCSGGSAVFRGRSQCVACNVRIFHICHSCACALEAHYMCAGG